MSVPRSVMAAIVIVLVASACTMVVGEVGSGAVTTESRTVGPFTKVEADGGIHVDVTIGPASPVVVSAQTNILPIIVTEVVGDTLRIHSSKGYTTTQRVSVQATTPSLVGVTLNGGSEAKVDGLVATDLTIDLSGGAVLTVASKQADTIHLSGSGGARAELAGLTATTVDVDMSGGATATVTATGTVSGTASGGARVTVSGGAAIDVQTSGGAAVDRS